MEERLLQLKSNALQHLQSQQSQNANPQQNLETIIEEVVKKYLKNLSPQPQQNKNELQNDMFIVKSKMKASIVALKVENILLEKRKAIISGLGYAIVPVIDAVLLIQKDMARRKVKVNIDSIELFEKTVQTINGKNKVLSGVRITLSI